MVNAKNMNIHVIYHFVRKHFVAELNTMLEITTRSNAADILTMLVPAGARWIHV